MGLVLWICIFVMSIADLFGYIDDNFSFELEGKVLWYEPYGCYFPAKQTRLLRLWDRIGLPHEKAKQEYGPTLRIIGFLVDPNEMRISMDDQDRLSLIEHVTNFISTAPGGTRRSLREFQQLAGWVNWSFNVFPLLKPALSNIYDKIRGKSESLAKIFINKAVVEDLSWFISNVRESDGIFVFDAFEWDIDQADVIAYADACLTGMGFFFTDTLQGYRSPLPHAPPRDTIFYFEAFVVFCVIAAACDRTPVPHRLVIYSDNSNTVAIFNSLRCKPPYNGVLKASVSLLLRHHISLRVFHVPGDDNVVADALSRFEDTRAIAACPGLSISSFEPPRLTMGRLPQ
jgi:hypothetical protein